MDKFIKRIPKIQGELYRQSEPSPIEPDRDNHPSCSYPSYAAQAEEGNMNNVSKVDKQDFATPGPSNSSPPLSTAKPPNKIRKQGERGYVKAWEKKFSWLKYEMIIDRVFCNICRTAVNMKFINTTKLSETAFIVEGFCNWKKGLERFKIHEKSSMHKEALQKTYFVQSGVNINAMILEQKQNEMHEARIALMKILTSIQYLTAQGLAIRGHTDEKSNLITLLNLRSSDSEELSRWLKKQSYKWYSHDIQNEMIEIMAHEVLQKINQKIKENGFYSIMLDETADISTEEQVSICFRTVTDTLQVEEFFVGFYKTASTTSEALFSILKDILIRLNLSLNDCRGQCYDGASSMAGVKSGLKTKVLQVESRALFVHCSAHSLNLVIQDSMQSIPSCRDILNLIRELINFIKSSPKRLSQFKGIQNESSDSKNLRPFCPTRWTLRSASLISVISNYEDLMKFLDECSSAMKSDCGAKASGFLKQLETFHVFFSLSLTSKIFSYLEVTNTALQSKSLHFKEVATLITKLKQSISSIRSQFENFWKEVTMKAECLKLDQPILPYSVEHLSAMIQDLTLISSYPVLICINNYILN